MNEKRCYVLMPFAPKFDPVYDAINYVATELGFQCSRADKGKDLGLITQGIITDILFSDLIVVDISEFNPNVLYELGIAHILSKPTVILSQELKSGGDLPFDITNMLTIAYELPSTARDEKAQSLMGQLRRYVSANRINHNPVSITLSAEHLKLANYFGHQFLWGYAKTLSESSKAKEVWVVSRRLYWERLDGLFYRKIFEERILLGKRKEYVLLPDSEENRYRQGMLIEKYKAINPNVENYFKVLLLDDERPFAFLPTEISIYDPGTPELRAILLEPMAQEGVDYENDQEIARALINEDAGKLSFLNLKEATFDLSLTKAMSERISVSFKSVWNEACLKRYRKDWLL